MLCQLLLSTTLRVANSAILGLNIIISTTNKCLALQSSHGEYSITSYSTELHDPIENLSLIEQEKARDYNPHYFRSTCLHEGLLLTS
jgi:hypothetical protein